MAKNIINITEEVPLSEVKDFMRGQGYKGQINNEQAVNYALKNLSNLIKHLDEESLKNLIEN